MSEPRDDRDERWTPSEAASQTDDFGAVADADDLYDYDDIEEDEEFAAAPAANGESDDDTPEEARLRSLVDYLASNLIDAEGGVVVRSKRRGQAVHLSLAVPSDELGKVIGRQGRIARAIRTAVMISGSRQDVRATLDIES